MTQEELDLIKYRMERGREAIEEAKLLFGSGHINSYINRLYYACFYAVSALLLTKNISTNKHGYLRSVFHKELVRTNIISHEMGKHFDLLFNNRQKGDYADFVVFKQEEVEEWLGRTEKFVSEIERILQV